MRANARIFIFMLPKPVRLGGAAALLIGLLLLAACQDSERQTTTVEVFVPPTLAATPAPTAEPTATRGPATPTPPCVDNLQFLEDVTIPDGTVVQVGQVLDKRWRVENAGTCNWDSQYRIQLISGSPMGAATEQALFPARSGTEIEIQIQFVVPDESGLLRSAWQAFNPQDEPFGDPVFIEISVGEPTEAP